jgi:hypothetical protein
MAASGADPGLDDPLPAESGTGTELEGAGAALPRLPALSSGACMRPPSGGMPTGLAVAMPGMGAVAVLIVGCDVPVPAVVLPGAALATVFVRETSRYVPAAMGRPGSGVVRFIGESFNKMETVG